MYVITSWVGLLNEYFELTIKIMSIYITLSITFHFIEEVIQFLLMFPFGVWVNNSLYIGKEFISCTLAGVGTADVFIAKPTISLCKTLNDRIDVFA